MDLELQGRTAVVTGGSRGIGRAVAAELSAAGVAVVIAARRREPLEEAALQLGGPSRHRRVIAVPADTTDDASVRALMQRAATELGSVDILVNCAAPVAWLAPNPGLADLTADQFERALDVKVLGYLRCAREAAPLMRRRGWGRIINVAGLAARRAGSIIGSIRNAGVVALTKNLAAELGPHGINVTCVHPGLHAHRAHPGAGRTARRGREPADRGDRAGLGRGNRDRPHGDRPGRRLAGVLPRLPTLHRPAGRRGGSRRRRRRRDPLLNASRH